MQSNTVAQGFGVTLCVQLSNIKSSFIASSRTTPIKIDEGS